MISAYNLEPIWLELTMIPFLLVLAMFLGGRMAVSSEINRRFLLLVISTFAAAVFEVSIEIFYEMDISVLYTKLFFVAVNINAYCLMCYVAAYTRSISKRFTSINFLMLCVSIISFFMFRNDENIYMIFSPGFAVLFVTEGFCLQLIHQEYYGNGQFIVMNLMFLLLIDSFVIQYLFKQDIALVYSIATLMLYFTFFYMEAPTYRKLITAQKETEDARIRTEESIRQANVANKAKSNFLASTSHEIRTPMNAILGINEMIMAENPDPATRKASEDIRRAGNSLLTLVNNILDISKIEAGKMDLFENEYHLWELLKECEGYVIHRITQKAGLKFILDADKNLPEHVFGDALRLKQVLINLLDNAGKYTIKGSITLKVTGEHKTGGNILLRFAVSDTGIGMREKERANIFEPFERANILETRNIPGAGLGLTLVQNIADIMNGKITVESTYGKGSTFTFEVMQRLATGSNMTVGEYEEFLHNEMMNREAEDDIDEGASVWPDAKILVVDDTPVNLVVAKGMLKVTESQVDTSESGEDALEMMKKEHYDVVFLDHKMPGMDGIETLKHAKKYAEGTKFIALTANAGGNARAEYIAHGFDDYLPKPFKSDEMMRIMKECLNRKKA